MQTQREPRLSTRKKEARNASIATLLETSKQTTGFTEPSIYLQTTEFTELPVSIYQGDGSGEKVTLLVKDAPT